MLVSLQLVVLQRLLDRAFHALDDCVVFGCVRTDPLMGDALAGEEDLEVPRDVTRAVVALHDRPDVLRKSSQSRLGRDAEAVPVQRVHQLAVGDVAAVGRRARRHTPRAGRSRLSRPYANRGTAFPTAVSLEALSPFSARRPRDTPE